MATLSCILCQSQLVKKAVGNFLIYRIADDENWFWAFTPFKLKAMEVAYRIKGHAVEIKSIEF